MSNPYGISVTGTDLYVVENTGPGTGRIDKFTTSGTPEVVPLPPVLNNSPGFLTSSGGNIFLSNYGVGGAGTIGEYATSGATVNASLISGLNYARGVVVSGGKLFVTNYSASGTAGYLGEYSLTGGSNAPTFITGLNGPSGLALFDGNLFVADHTGGKIEEFTTAGGTVNSSLITGLGLGQINGIAVVPEPGSIVLAGLAGGLLLAVAWHRRRMSRSLSF